MSRTDHHAPSWVKALRAYEDGIATSETHRHTCLEYTGTWRPTHVAKRVNHDVAEANGWEPSPHWHDFSGSASGWYRVPVVRHPCEIDTSNGRCHRWIENMPTRWWGGISIGAARINRGYYRPERAAVRDSLRTAAKEYRGTGEVDEITPTRQGRNSLWNGGYWD